MTCAHCNAVEQRGRYCVGCGKLLPPSPLPARRVPGEDLERRLEQLLRQRGGSR